MSNFENVKTVPCTQAEYFAIDAISRTQIVQAWQNPAKYEWNQAHPIQTTKAMEFGTMVHELVLEELQPLRDAVIVNVVDCLTKKGEPSKTPKTSEAYKAAAVEAKAAGLPVYLDTEACSVRGAVWDCAGSVLREWPDFRSPTAETEVAIVADHVPSGLKVKARLDGLFTDKAPDLKVTADASKGGFTRKVRAFAYHVQDAFYGDLAGALMGWGDHMPFEFRCVEPDEPYLCATHTINDDWRAAGRDIYETTLCNMAAHMAHGWPTSYGRHELVPTRWDLEV
jgi:hypothetical protein